MQIRRCARRAAAQNEAMDTLRPADLAARVVAWHNRHPLARRIAPAQVTGIGAVSLPLALREPAPDGATGGAAGATTPLTPIFDTQWMYGADAAALDRFVVAHGAYPLDAAARWPWRHVDADLARARAADAQGQEGRTARHLLTAVIEADGRRSRVLVAPVLPLAQAAVFGRRLYSLPRVAGGVGSGAAAASAAVAALVVGLGSPRHPPVDVADAAPAVAAPASSAASADAAGATAAQAAAAPEHAASDPAAADPQTAEAAASRPAPGDTAAPDTALAAAAPVADFRPVDVPPMLQDAAAAGPLVRIRPTLTEDERRQARLQAQALRPPPAASAPGEALLKGPVYALATPPLRTRDDAQAQQVLLHGLKAQVATPLPTQLDVMPAGKRWRVVWWPHPQAEEAERLRLEASARGLKLEVIAF